MLETEEWSRRTLRRNVVPVQLRGIVEALDRHEPDGWTNGHGPTDLDQRQQEDHDGEGEEE